MSIWKHYCSVCSKWLESGSVCSSEDCKAKVYAELVAKHGPPQGDVLANWKCVNSKKYPRWERSDYRDLDTRPDDPEGYEAWEGAFVKKSPRADAPKPWIAIVQFGRPHEVGYERHRTHYKTEKEALTETDRLYPISGTERYLFKLAEERGVPYGLKLAETPKVDQTPIKSERTDNTQAYPPSVGHSGPPEFRDWNFVGSGPIELQRRLPAGHSDEFVRVFHAFNHDGWIAETYGGRTKSSVYQSANEAMLWANKHFFSKSKPSEVKPPKPETRWGVWIVRNLGGGASNMWHTSHRETGTTLGAASRLCEKVQMDFPLGQYQVREYINETTPGNLWTEPKTQVSFFEGGPSSGKSPIPAVLDYSGYPTMSHLMESYELKWEKTEVQKGIISVTLNGTVLEFRCSCGGLWNTEDLSTRYAAGVDIQIEQRCSSCDASAGWMGAVPYTAPPSIPTPTRTEVLGEWKYAVIPNGAQYIRNVPGRDLHMKVDYVSGRQFNTWLAYFAYNGAAFQWSGYSFATCEAAMSFCEERMNLK